MLGISHDVRTLLLSDTSLWTTVSLPLRYLHTAEYAELLEFMQTAVTRSGSQSLNLEWTTACAPSTSPDALRDLVLSVLTRARMLVLHHSYFQPYPQTFWITPTPRLQTLTISSTRPFGGFMVGESSAASPVSEVLRDLFPPIAPHIVLDSHALGGSFQVRFGRFRLAASLGLVPAL